MTRKARYDGCGARIIQERCMKSFNESEFLEDLKHKEWNDSSASIFQICKEVRPQVTGRQEQLSPT